MFKKLLYTTAIVSSFTISGLANAYEGHEGGFKKVLSKLPAAKAEAFRNTIKASREKNEGLHDQAKKLHDDLYTIIIAEPFDKDAYLKKAHELEVLHEKMHANKQGAMAEAINGLSQSERRIFADSMREMHKKHEQHAHHDGKKPADSEE